MFWSASFSSSSSSNATIEQQMQQAENKLSTLRAELDKLTKEEESISAKRNLTNATLLEKKNELKKLQLKAEKYSEDMKYAKEKRDEIKSETKESQTWKNYLREAKQTADTNEQQRKKLVAEQPEEKKGALQTLLKVQQTLNDLPLHKEFCHDFFKY